MGTASLRSQHVAAMGRTSQEAAICELGKREGSIFNNFSHGEVTPPETRGPVTGVGQAFTKSSTGPLYTAPRSLGPPSSLLWSHLCRSKRNGKPRLLWFPLCELLSHSSSGQRSRERPLPQSSPQCFSNPHARSLGGIQGPSLFASITRDFKGGHSCSEDLEHASRGKRMDYTRVYAFPARYSQD